MMVPAFEIPGFVTATATLTLSALFAMAALNIFKPNSIRIHRAVWMVVLLNGIMVTRFAIELPVLQSVESKTTSQLFADDNLDQNRIQLDDPSVGQIDRPAELNEEASEGRAVAVQGDSHAPSGPASTSLGFKKLLLIGWGVGLFIALVVLGMRYVKVLLSIRRAVPVGGAFQAENRTVSRRMGIRKPVPILFHDQLGPALIGTINGFRILVPEEFWSSISREQRIAVLRHEYTHLQRGDIWKSFVATFLAAIQWFNPFAWFAVRRFNEAAEWACDASLSNQDDTQKAGFARALLSLSTSNPTHLVGASTMASSDLSVRVQRLLVGQQRDSLARKLAMTVVVCLLFLIGWINVRLVAAPAIEPNAPAMAQQDDVEAWNKKIEELASTLSEEDELSKQLAAILKTPSGKVAMNNRVGWLEEEMRQEAIKNIVAEFFGSLKDSDIEDINVEVAKARDDIDKVGTALTELRSQISGTDEADQMFMRLLNDKNSPRVLYFGQFRNQIRPGKEQLMYRLGDFLASDGEGNFIVRESVKDKLAEQINNINARKKYLKIITDELLDWSEDVHAKDELHQRIKDGFKRENAAVMVLASFEGDSDDPAEQYFEFLERIFEDTAQGLELRDDRREDVEEASAQMQRQIKKLEVFRKPIDEVAEQIDTRDPVAKLAQEFLKSELGKCMIIREIDYAGTTPEGIIQQIMNDVLIESSEGQGYMIREDVREQVLDFVRETFRRARRFRRHARMLDAHVGELSPAWQSTFDSPEAKEITIERIEQIAEAKRFDAWPQWMERHFESVAGKHVIQEDAQDEIRELIQDAKNIESELEKDDF